MPEHPPDRRDSRAHRFYDNALRHLVLVSQHLKLLSLERVRTDHDHPQLRPGYEPYISMLGVEGTRLTELARVLGITAQSCNQTTNRLQGLGYIERIPDPRDGRAKLLRLSDKGRELLQQGYVVAMDIDRQCQTILGARELRQLKRCIARLSERLTIPPLRLNQANFPADTPVALVALLPRVGDFAQRRFHSALIAAAGDRLREIHVQLLMRLGQYGGTLKELAAAQEVTVQAVFVVARELQVEGYIQPVPDAYEPRQHRWQLTAEGEALLHSAIDGVEALEDEFRAVLGRGQFNVLRNNLRELVDAFGLSREPAEDVDLQKLARRLRLQLGDRRATLLSQLLQDA